MLSRVHAAAAALALVACVVPTEESSTEQGLTAAVRRERATLIRDSAAEMGMFNAALLGGIAISETNLAHCYSEASFACPGPNSPSCGDGPVIAGGADGPCADMQGGLGMFQFDAGTYAQTLATYGPTIVTVEGNTAQVVNFVQARLAQEIAGVTSWGTAMSYLNSVPLVSTDPKAIEWGNFLACRYNGCCSMSATCNSRGAAYRDNAISIYREFGADFWRTADRCIALPDDGVIDQRSACYMAAGDPRYWRREAVGYGDASEWTSSTSNAAAKNYAQWLVHAPVPGRYRVEAYMTGGEAKAAAYKIAHAGMAETVTVDQSTSDGWVMLGDFDFTGEGDEHVELGDNTGTTMQKLVYDAVRVTSLDGPPLPEEEDDGGDNGGCAAAGGGSGLALALGLLAIRRRRRQ